MKKTSLLVTLLMIITLVTGCGKSTKTEKNEEKEESKTKLVLNQIYYDAKETDFETNSKPEKFVDDFGSEVETKGYVSYITFKENNKATAVLNMCMGFMEEEVDYKITNDNGKEYVELKGFGEENVKIEIVSEKELRVESGAFDCGSVDGFKLYEK